MSVSNTVVLLALAAFMLANLALLYSIDSKLSSVAEAFSSEVSEGVNTATASAETGASLGGLVQPTEEQSNGEVKIPENIVRYNVSEGDDPFIGNESAPVVIVEFSDYQCPFCLRFWQQSFSPMKKEYVDTGKVKFIYKDFPIGQLHPMATRAAEAANCAGEQGKYWEYHDLLFENQNEWANGGLTELKAYAEELGLNVSEFEGCVLSAKYREEIKEDYDEGAILGVKGTPTFFINGRMLVGAQPYYKFKEIIEQELYLANASS